MKQKEAGSEKKEKEESPEPNKKMPAFVKWFSEMSNKDISIAGGKGASLAEMYNYKFPIPPGFVVTAQAYAYFIEKSAVDEKIKELLSDINIEETAKLEEACKKVRGIIMGASLPKELEEAIAEAYDVLDADKKHFEGTNNHVLSILKNSEPPFVAVRSSATTEDLADASFAGQQESFLNVKGSKKLLQKVKECFASLFTARAVYYRAKKGFSQDKAYIAVVVQKMVNSDKSGVIFSRNPVSTDENIVIEAVWGLGEGIVSGRIKPDNYVVGKDLAEFKIISASVSEKKVAIVRDSSGKNIIVKLTEERSKQQVLSSYEIKILAQYAKKLEEHYKKPQDIEFAISDGEIYIVQSRPITTKFSMEKAKELAGEVLLSGLGASPGVASGVVKIIHDLSELNKVKKGDVLVTEMTNPDMVVSMQKAAAIVTNEGGITSHAAIVSREMGIPAVVGTGNATLKLKEGEVVTVDGTNGRVLEGKGETKLLEINPIVATKTKIKVMVDLPDFAERAALSKASAVGLARIEGIIAESGKHPIYFVKNKKIEDYSKLIFNGLQKIAEHFDEMWIRTSDIRSDEFMNLEGAPEKAEGNPMLGNHGIRFSLKNPLIIEAEVAAVKNLAVKFPNKKFGIMIPQVISVSEFLEAKKIAEKIGVPKNIALGIMVETPAAVQIINFLCEAGISFISFGTNDLTQYILAIDRNNEEVQYLYNELDPAVLSAISYVIRRCKKYGVETSICGQAGSNDEMVKFLVSEGIDSISVNADAAERVSRLVAELEKSGIYNKVKHPGMSLEHKIVSELKNFFGAKPKEEKKFESPFVAPVMPPMPSQSMETSEPEKPVESGRAERAAAGEDIEEVILKELESEEMDNYVPGQIVSDKGIPLLNDAIPIDSEYFEGEKKEKERE